MQQCPVFHFVETYLKALYQRAAEYYFIFKGIKVYLI